MYWRIDGARNATPNVDAVRCTGDSWFFFFETQVRRLSRCLGYRYSGEVLTDWRKQAGRQTRRREFVADYKVCRLRLQSKSWLLKWRRQAGQAKRWFCWQCCNVKKKILNLIDTFLKAVSRDWIDECWSQNKTDWLIFKQHRSWFFLKRVPNGCRINKIDRDFFWNAYRSNCQQIDQIDVFSKIVFDDLFFVQSFN